MATPRFCMSCGTELEPGSRFCQSCGAAAGAGQEPAAGAVCRNCGAELVPGRRFCTSCGTPVAGEPTHTQAPVAGIPRDKLPLVLGGIAAIVVVAILALTVLGGGDDNGASGLTDSGGGGFGSGGGLNPDIGIAEFPEPVPVDLPAGDSLLGPDNRVASAAIRSFLAENGLDLAGVDIFVFPIANTGESMLVLAADFEALTTLDTSSSDTGDDPGDDVLGRLQELPAVRAANVTRVTMNLSGVDAQGPFVMTITMPIDALDPDNPDYADLTDEQALELLKVQISR